MNEDIVCQICDDGCRFDQDRLLILKEWLQPFVDHYSLDLKGLKGFAFTPKLAVSNYGAEFLRRKNGESWILISEELWSKSVERLHDLRVLQNTLQHELGHVHNNNVLHNLPGKLVLLRDDQGEDISGFIYRAWDEFYATQLAAYSEPAGLLQAKMTGILTESKLLQLAMGDLGSGSQNSKEIAESLFLICVHLAGSYFGNEDLQETIMEGSLKTHKILHNICQISEAGEQMLKTYPFHSFADLLPLARLYFDFLQEAERLYRAPWRRLLSPKRLQKVVAQN